MSRAGTVARLWRYPVKSLRGEACASARFDASGMEHDRPYAIRGADGRLGSGKSTRRMRQIDGLLGLGGCLAEGRPSLRFADGRLLACDAPQVHAALSAALGEPVTLSAEPREPHVDAAPLHLITTASLAWLRGRLPGSAIDERRFRPNLVLEVAGAEPVEAGWIGRTLRIGEQLWLRIVERTERCRMVTLAQEELPGDAGILRALAQEQEACFGVYAEVAVPGAASAGDPVRFA